jgi:acyl carrier protein
MGLEGVEIVMEVEDAFDITLLDSEAEKVRTPRDLIELVMGKVGRADVAVCLTQRAFHRLRRAFMTELNVKRAGFSLDLPMQQLLPLDTRRLVLARISGQLGVAKPPDLERPHWLKTLLAAVSLMPGIAIAFALSPGPASGSLLVNLIRSFNWLPGILAFFCLLILGISMTKKCATEFPARLRTVRGMTRWLVANNPQLLGAPPGQWSRELVAEKVRDIVITHFGEKKYREDARFVEDMGMN